MDHRLIALLQKGQAAAREGRTAEARRLFRAVLSRDPANGPALLWMTWLSNTPRARLAYASRALALYPDHARVREAHEWAESRVDRPVQEGPGSRERLEPERKRRWRRLVPIIALGSLGAFFAGMLLILVWFAPQHLPIIGGWRATVTPTPTPTATPLLAPSPTPNTAPTSTHTVRPAPTESDTATPTATPSPTPTPSPSSTPNPTQPPPSPTPDNPSPTDTPASNDARWIDVDLSQQQLTAYEGETPVRTITVSTGLPHTPTPVGQFRIYIKLLKTDMRGPDYHLRDVPYTMYFYLGYGIHGTYWHSNFGQPMSAGCINLPIEEAEWLFYWASVGTLVNIHQ